MLLQLLVDCRLAILFRRLEASLKTLLLKNHTQKMSIGLLLCHFGWCSVLKVDGSDSFSVLRVCEISLVSFFFAIWRPGYQPPPNDGGTGGNASPPLFSLSLS